MTVEKSPPTLATLMRRRNHLLQVLQVQAVYQGVADEDLSFKYLWRKHVRDTHHISYRTFLTYINTKAEKELKEINQEIFIIKK